MELNRDIKTRDEMIFGEYNPERYSGGCRNFDEMNLETIKELIDKGFCDPDECQNSSPTVEEFVNFIANHEGWYLNGYAITDKRHDYRVSITGMCKERMIEDIDELKDFVEFARFADEFDMKFGYAWWD